VRDLLIGAPVFLIHDPWVAPVCPGAVVIVWYAPAAKPFCMCRQEVGIMTKKADCWHVCHWSSFPHASEKQRCSSSFRICTKAHRSMIKIVINRK